MRRALSLVRVKFLGRRRVIFRHTAYCDIGRHLTRRLSPSLACESIITGRVGEDVSLESSAARTLGRSFECCVVTTYLHTYYVGSLV